MLEKFNGVDAEARGKLRLFRQRASDNYEKFLDLKPVLWPVVGDFFCKKGIGRERAWRRLSGLMGGVDCRLMYKQMRGRQPLVIWAILKPRGAVRDTDDPRYNQACICVDYFSVGWSPLQPQGGWHMGLWALEVTEHGLGRYMQRSPDANLSEAMFAAHRALLHVADQVLLNRVEFWLAVDPHVWACETAFGIDVNEQRQIHVTARTYLEFDQISPQREAQLVRAGNTWSKVLLPLPFRKITEVGDKLKIEGISLQKSFVAAA
jgi:hypothetical protein